MMRHGRGWAVCIAVAACALLLAGCYEDPEVTVYESGVYKGKSDPLLAKLESGDLHDQLERRFTRAQTYE